MGNLRAIPWNECTAAMFGGVQVVVDIYRDLVREGLLETVFHERHYDADEFVRFFTNHPYTRSVIFWDDGANRCPGIAWAMEIAPMHCGTRAAAGFAFFRWALGKERTVPLGVAGLRHFFMDLGIDLIYGVTPKPNRLSMKFTRSLGMEYKACAPGFTCYNGKFADAMFCLMTKDRFIELHGAEYPMQEAALVA